MLRKYIAILSLFVAGFSFLGHGIVPHRHHTDHHVDGAKHGHHHGESGEQGLLGDLFAFVNHSPEGLLSINEKQRTEVSTRKGQQADTPVPTDCPSVSEITLRSDPSPALPSRFFNPPFHPDHALRGPPVYIFC